jgi:hypothetical protein
MQYTVAYTLAQSEDNLTSINYFDRNADWGPSSLDRRHTLVVSGSVMIPLSFTVGGVWTMRSAMPFSALAGKDLNNDGATTDLVPGTTRNSGQRSLNIDAVNTYRALNGLAPVSIAQVDSNRYNSLDVRITRTFKLTEAKKVEIVGQIFNIMGSDNLLASGGLGGYVNNALSDSFGRILAAGNRQQAELAVRFAW